MWEAQEMARPVDFSVIRIDPAPFQLVEKTSILKVGEGVTRSCTDVWKATSFRGTIRKGVVTFSLGQVHIELSNVI